MPHFWSRVSQPGKLPFHMLINADDADQAHHIALAQSLSAGDVIAATDQAACQTCPSRDACFASHWEGAYTKLDQTPGEDGKPRPVLTNADRSPTYVHSCPVCLDTFLSAKGEDALPAPDDCPRRDPQRDTVVCGPCLDKRLAVQSEHPRYQTLIDANAAYQEAHKDDSMEVTALAPGVVDFGKRHRQVESERALARASEPFSYITSADQFDRPMGVLAMWVLLGYWDCLPEDLRAFMAMSPEPVAMAKREWLEELYLALLRHRNKTFPEAAKGITEEWVQGFTDQGNLSLGWMAMPLHQRRDLRAAWAKAVEDILTDQLHGPLVMPPETINRLFNEP